ncbi:ABC transporter ATP-binding protein [Rhodobacteraceae bacterium CCMM004]|nr:ABC transporter ATP-binding protein [Rhodobacteraceae bacterium CCMM004]
MIRLRNVHKTFRVRAGYKTIARGVNMDFPKGKCVALLGRNGAGKSSLMNMLAGSMQPDRGTILIDGSVSWPVGFQGSFHNDLTGSQNTRFLARVYGVDTDELVDFVQDFAELGKHFHQPLRTYSSGMRSRLGFGVSMGIHFDIYLVDEVTAVGDAAFKEKSMELFLNRMEQSSSIFVSHSMSAVREICDVAVVLENGRMRYFRDVDEGIAQHEHNMFRKRKPG